MHVAINQSRGQSRSFGVDHCGRTLGIDIFLFADGRDFAADAQHGVSVENGLFEIAAEKEANISDDEATGRLLLCCFLRHALNLHSPKPPWDEGSADRETTVFAMRSLNIEELARTSKGASGPGPVHRSWRSPLSRFACHLLRSLYKLAASTGWRAEMGMAAGDLVLWAVDTQADFMFPGGKLYVPGAEKLLPNIQKLTDTAREGRVFMVSHGCYHSENDPEFRVFPPHCIQGTPGSDFVAHAMTEKVARVPNDPASTLPQDLSSYQQVLLEKQTLDVFETRHAASLLRLLPQEAEFIVFGVVTEYCVRFAAKGLLERGRRVSVVEDAIETLDLALGRKTIAELQVLGARIISTQQAVTRLLSTA